MVHETYQGVYRASGVYASMVIALVGGATWAAMEQVDPIRLGPDTLQMIRLTTGTAWLGGLAVSPLFGRSGGWGIALSLIGAVLATAIGAALAAAVFDPVGLIFGPLFVFGIMAQSPLVATVWVTGMTLAHLAAERSVRPGSSGST